MAWLINHSYFTMIDLLFYNYLFNIYALSLLLTADSLVTYEWHMVISEV